MQWDGSTYAEAVIAFGVVTGALHKWLYLPWAQRRQLRREQEREDDLFLHGDDGIDGVRPGVQTARMRLAHVEEGVEELRVGQAELQRGQAAIMVAARALLTERGETINGTTQAAVAAIDDAQVGDSS